MIFEAAKSSLMSANVLLSIEDLLGNSQGGRMPDVQPAHLTVTIAQRAVDACPTSALAIEPDAERPLLRLDYGECIACGRCREASDAAFVVTDKFTRCGVSRRERSSAAGTSKAKRNGWKAGP